jgi:hypothetical protein
MTQTHSASYIMIGTHSPFGGYLLAGQTMLQSRSNASSTKHQQNIVNKSTLETIMIIVVSLL